MNPHAEAQVPKTCVSAISPLPRVLSGKNTHKMHLEKINVRNPAIQSGFTQESAAGSELGSVALPRCP